MLTKCYLHLIIRSIHFSWYIISIKAIKSSLASYLVWSKCERAYTFLEKKRGIKLFFTLTSWGNLLFLWHLRATYSSFNILGQYLAARLKIPEPKWESIYAVSPLSRHRMQPSRSLTTRLLNIYLRRIIQIIHSLVICLQAILSPNFCIASCNFLSMRVEPRLPHPVNPSLSPSYPDASLLQPK